MKTSPVFRFSLFISIVLFIAGFALLIIDNIFGPSNYEKAWRLEDIGFPLIMSSVFIWCTSLIAIAIASRLNKQD